jgi:polyhydroxyalkanoate synthesis repressor PhaR
MPRQIKRYGNRKLYDSEESRYVTLDDIASFVRAGEDVRVIDNDTAEDLTAITFAQIILEQERRASGFLPAAVLRRMIEQGEAAIHGLAQRVDKEVEVIRSIGERAGKRVQEIVGRGAPTGKGLLDELLAVPQRRLEELQKRVDEGVRQSIDRFRSVPAVERELRRIERSIQRLEQILGRARNASDANDTPAERKDPEER